MRRRSRASRVVIVGTLLILVASMLLGSFDSNPVLAYNAGQVDTTYTPSTTAANTVSVLSDGSVLVGLSENVVKYTSTGASAGVTATYDGVVGTVKVISGDKFYVAGGWSTKRALRYNADGTEDTTFAATTAPGRTYDQDGVEVGSDGSVYVTGGTSPYLYKFSSTGVRDTSFNTALGPAPWGNGNDARAIALQSDGKILVGVSNGSLKRYNTNGTLDSTLVSSGLGQINSIVELSDGSIVTASATSPYLRKYSSTGSLDASFASALGSSLGSTAQVVRLDGLGRLVVGGAFTGYVKRFSAGGVPDANFNTAAAASSLGSVSSLAIQSDGNILVAYSGGVKRLLGSNVSPNTPSAPTAVAGDGQATVTVTQPSGATPTYFTISAVEESGKSCTVTGSSGSCIVSGLTNGSTYTFTATATNIDATSAASSASNAVTPLTSPILASATVNSAGNSLILTYNKELSTTTAPTSAFEVYVDSVLTPGSSVQASGSTVSLSITPTIGIGQVVTVKYTAPTSSDATTNNAIQNLLGNDALSFSTRTATNNSTRDITAPVFGSAATSTVGDKITLTYNETLNATTATTGMFEVRADGNLVTVTSATVSGSTVLLNLNPLINEGQVVTVTYSAPSTVSVAPTNNAIQDTTGNDAITVTSASVSNVSIKTLTCATNKATGGTGGSTRSATQGGNGCVTVSYGTTTEQFSYVGEPYSWTVPTGVTSVTFKAYGAGGGGITTGGDLGSSTAYNGGSGGYVEKTYSVTPGQSFTITVGAGGIGNLVTKGTLTYGVTYAYTNSGSGLVDLASSGSFPVGTQVTLSGLGTAFDGVKTVTSVSGSRINFTNSFTGYSNPSTTGATASAIATCVSSVLTSPYGGGGAARNTACATTGNRVDFYASGGGGSAVYTNSASPVALISAGGGGGAGSQGNGGAGGGNDVSATTGGNGSAGSGSGLNGGGGATTTAIGAGGTTASPTIPGAINGGAGATRLTSGFGSAAGGNSTGGGGGGGGGYYGGGAGGTGGGGGGGSSFSLTVDLVGPALAASNQAVLGANGYALTLTFDETLGGTNPTTSSFLVYVDGRLTTVSSLSKSGATVILNLPTSLSSDQVLTVSYVAPTSNSATSNAAVQDAAGNDAVSFTNQAVTNNSALGPDVIRPVLTTSTPVTVSGTKVTLAFNETLLGTPALPLSAFTVFVGETAYKPTAAVVVGSTVELTIGTSLSAGTVIDVSYEAPTNSAANTNSAIQDPKGNDALSFTTTNTPYSNLWSWAGGPTASTAGCSSPFSANRTKQTTLPNGVTYSVGVTGDYLCISDATESLSQRGGAAGDFVATGLVTEPGVLIQTSNVNCAASALCTPRGTLTMTFSKTVVNPVVSFAGWGGGSGSSTAWSEMTVVTPGVTVTALSGTNMQVVNSGTKIEPIVKNPSVNCHLTSGYGATAQAGCGSLQINGAITSVSFDVTLTTARGTGYLDQWNLTASMSEDFGLVPTTYESAGVASHGVGALRMGPTVLADQASALYATTNADAVARWASLAGNAKADDGVAAWSSSPTINFGAAGSTYSTTVALGGVTSTANLCGWIDFNRDEVFGYSERACATDPVSGATSATLSWIVPANVVAGPTYARVRLSYEGVTVPTGKLASGEVEDYSLVIPSSVVPATLEDTSINGQGITQTISPLTNDQIETGSPWNTDSVRLCYSGQVPNDCTATELVVSGEGTFRVQTDGTVKFIPEPNFTGVATPVTYQVTDTNSSPRTKSSTITPTVIPAPTASPNTNIDVQGATQIINPLSNDSAATGYTLNATTVKLCGADDSATPTVDESAVPNCNATTLTISGQGTYTVNTDGTVTFVPLSTYTGTATAVTYQVKDSIDQVATSTITPTVIPAPTASPDTNSDVQGATQIIDPLSNDSAATGYTLNATTVKLCGADDSSTPTVDESAVPNCNATTLAVSGVGTYSVNPTTGVVTFVPLPNYTGTAPSVTYQITDSINQVASSTITPTVIAPPSPSASVNTGRAGHDVNQTVTPTANDTPGAPSIPFVLSTVKLCGADDSLTPTVDESTPPNCNATSLTVPGEGTYTVNSTTGAVTFDPLETFDGTATAVRYQAADTLDRFVNSTITLIVDPPTAPVANPETKSLLPGGTATFTTITGTSGLASGTGLVTTGANATCLFTPTTTTCDADNSVTITGEGTYVLDPATGIVTFTALSSITAGTKTPITYRVTDIVGQTATSTLTPIIPPPPAATDDTSSGNYDTNQTINPLTNDAPGAVSAPLVATTVKLCGLANASATPPVTAETPPNCTKTTLTVTGEGTYTVDPTTGVVTFDPLPTFKGGATPVDYQVADSLGQITDATITVSVNDPPLPTASPDAITDAYDTNQTYTSTTNDTPGSSSFPFVASTVKLCGANDPATPSVDESVVPNCNATTLTVTGEGTYTVNPTTGVVTFDPVSSFTGTVATVVRYQVTDTLSRVANSTITPTVGAPPVPTASPDAITDAYDTNQTYTPVANDTKGAADFPFVATTVKLCGISPAQTPPSCTQTTLIVAGEGTYTVDPTTGVVTFDPVSSFTGTVGTVVRYQVTDTLSRVANSTITPTVGAPPVPTASPDAITDAYDTNQTYSPVTNDTKGAADFPFVATTVKLCGANDPATPSIDESVVPNCNATTLTVSGEGTYTVDPTTGVVTFDPVSSFTGTVGTVVKYQVADTLGRVANSTITPTVGAPPVPTASPDAQTRAHDTNQTYTPVANDTKGAADFPFVATTVKLCGANDPATPSVDESVVPNCNATTLTIAGEGTYTVDPVTGVVTFDPLPSFKGTVATVVAYQATDTLGRVADSTITPTVTPPTAPTAAPETKSVLPGGTITFTTITGSSGLATGTGLATTGATATCLIDPATPTVCSTGFTNSDGTWSINQATGVVTFVATDPLAEGTKTAVTYRVTDVTGQTATSTLTPIVPPPPGATNDISTDAYDTNQLINPLTNDSAGAASAPLVATTVKLCGISPVQTPNSCDKTTLTVPGEGTYTVNPVTGVVTFDPLPTFTGTVATPVRYQVTDLVGRTVNATITPTVTPPPVPTATPNTGRGAYDTNQTVNPITNDTPGAPAATFVPTTVKLCGISPIQTPNSCDKTTLTVPGEGTYTVNPVTGVVTFDPLPTFTGTATPVVYQVTDILNRTVSSTITLTVDPPSAPTATPETKLVLPGSSVAFTTITGSSGLATGTELVTTGATATCLFTPGTTTCDADNSVTITGEGTYVLDPATGIVTFTALSSAMSGTKPSITYRVTDIVGQTATSTLTPIIPDPPAATNDVSSGPYDTNQEISPLSNDSFSSLTPAVKATLKLCGLDPLQTPNSCDKTSLVVPNEGTYTLNSTTGVVTFDPLPSFTGTVATPPTYQVADSVGRYVNATITPTVSAPDAPTAKPETKLVLPGATISFTTTTGASGLATGTGLATSGPTATCLFTPGTTTCDADNSVTIVGEGTYVLDPATGIVTFTASATIMPGTKTPITYRVTDALGQTATSTLTPIVPAPPAATNDAISDAYDTNQTYTPLANDSFSSLAPVSKTTLKLCGVEPVQKPNDCDKTSVTVPNEGTYTLNADGTVTFDPLPTFSGTATPLVYQVADSLGRFVNATITPTVAPPPVPAATLDTGKAKQGTKITLSPWLNDDGGTVDSTGEKLALVPTSVRLCGVTTLEKMEALSTTSQNVTCSLTKLKTADGTYTVDVKTGKVSFVHKKGFSGTVTEPVKYSIANSFKGAAGPGIATGVLIPTIVPTSVPSVTLGDKVWRDLNGDGYQGPGDGGIAGVTVKVLTVKGKPVRDLFGKIVKPVVSDINGAFRFTGLPGGRYKLIVTYPENFRPTIPDRPGREKNSSTTQAITKVLKIGQSDLSLDFGMVPKMTSGLAHTM